VKKLDHYFSIWDNVLDEYESIVLRLEKDAMCGISPERKDHEKLVNLIEQLEAIRENRPSFSELDKDERAFSYPKRQMDIMGRGIRTRGGAESTRQMYV